MNGFRDPVDSAMDSLRSEEWSAAPFTPEQETLLMQQAHNQNNGSSPKSYRTLIVALAVLFVGGAAFAATNGVQRLRTWLFDVDTGDGGRAQILVEDGQTGTMIIEDDDGNVTEIEATGEELDDGGMRTKVTVRKSGKDTEDEEVQEIIRRRGRAPVETTSLDVLKDAEFITEWYDEAERVVELYAKSNADEKDAQFYIVVEGFEPNLERRIAATPALPALFLDGKTTIDVDKADTISLKFDTGEQVAMLKFATAESVDDIDEDVDGRIKIDSTEDGDIRVRVESGE